MSDKIRWRRGDTNPVLAAVDSATVIEIGDLVWQDVNRACPALDLGIRKVMIEGKSEEGSVADLKEMFAKQFQGVAIEPSQDGDVRVIRVATTGVFEFECPPADFELGDLVGVIPNDTGRLQNQTVTKTTEIRHAIGRVAERSGAGQSFSVLVDIRSQVMGHSV